MATQAIALANVQTYLQRVNQLYVDVRKWMTALEPGAQFSESEIEIAEEATGTYKAKALDISRPARLTLNLVPHGRYMLGAEGQVDVRSQLGREILVWVRAGAPALGFRFSRESGQAPEDLYGDPTFPGIAEGWAWDDEDRGELLHLDLTVFRDRILNSLGNA